MGRFYYILLLFISISSFFGQIKNPGSDLTIAKSDTVKIRISLNLGELATKTNPQEAISHFENARLLAQHIGNDVLARKACSSLSTAFARLGKFSRSLEYDLEALELARKLQSKLLLTTCFGDVATDYFNLQNYPSALDFSLRSLKISEQINSKAESANTYNTIGSIHLMMKNFDKALENYVKSLQMFKDLKDSIRIAATYDNIASVYSLKNQVNKLLENAFLSLKIKENIHDTIGKAYSYLTIGDGFYKKTAFDSAMKYYGTALDIFIKLKENLGLSQAYWNVANVCFEKGDLDNTQINLDQGIKVAEEISDKRQINTFYSFYVDLYEKRKDYKRAFEFQKKFIALNDSLFNVDKNEQIAEMQTKYETEKKEKEIAGLTQKTQLLTQENKIQNLELSRNWYILIGLGSSIVLILVIAFLLSGRNKLKAAQSKMQVEQKLFRSQMNPHFIFNSLIAIQNYVYKHEASETAKYISNFAKLMRMILENSRNEYVTIEKELNTLKYYLELQQLRFQDKFDFSIEVDPLIDAESVSIPPMLSQPFIENAIEHGIMNKQDGKGMITIRFVQKSNMIEMTVEDNGIGRQSSANSKIPEKAGHVSLATTITEERLNILNKNSKQKFTFNVTDLKNQHGLAGGTLVCITMPES